MLKAILIFVLSAFLLSCAATTRKPETEKAVNKTAETIVSPTAQTEKSPEKVLAETAADETKKSENAPSKKECLSVDTGDNALLETQTFPIDFKPFRASCFVTSYNPEYDDPPLESEFSIYTDGKKVFDFPDRFNGITTGCWITGAAFQDLNADSLTDIIIAGMCNAKSAPYSENAVYINTGKDFTTNIDANYKLENFKKIADIEKFVKANQSLFFK